MAWLYWHDQLFEDVRSGNIMITMDKFSEIPYSFKAILNIPGCRLFTGSYVNILYLMHVFMCYWDTAMYILY